MHIFHKVAVVGLTVLMMGSTAALHAQYGPPQGPPPQGYNGQGGWDSPQGQMSDMMRRGFHDGIEGAQKDYENHRQPNVNNRDEFRHPSGVPGPLRHEYREGFRRGYDAGVRHMMNGGPR